MMHEEIDPDEEEVAESWHVEDLGSAEWAMRRVAKATQELAEIDAAEQQWREEIDEWRAKVAKRPNQTVEFFTEHLSRFARNRRAINEDKKTLVLPSGEVRTKISKEKIVVDDKQAAIEWARTGAPDAIKITESLLVSELAAHVVIRQGVGGGQSLLIDPTSGEIVSGLSLDPAVLSVTVVPQSKATDEPEEVIE